MNGLRNGLAKLLCCGALALAGCASVGTAQTDLRTAVEARQPALNDCYREGLARDGTAAGDLDVRLAMDSGASTVRDVAVIGSEVQDPGLTSCLRAELASVSIEQGPGVDMEVDYTLRLEPESN